MSDEVFESKVERETLISVMERQKLYDWLLDNQKEELAKTIINLRAGKRQTLSIKGAGLFSDVLLVSDLRIIIPNDLFRQIECDVVTQMVDKTNLYYRN